MVAKFVLLRNKVISTRKGVKGFSVGVNKNVLSSGAFVQTVYGREAMAHPIIFDNLYFRGYITI